VLGLCSVGYAELMTNKPTLTELALSNRISRVRIGHCLKTDKVVPQKPLTSSTGIHFRLIDVIE